MTPLFSPNYNRIALGDAIDMFLSRSVFVEVVMQSLHFKICTLLILCAMGSSSMNAAEPIPFTKVAPLIKQHCSKCHDSSVVKPKGKLKIDKLNTDLVQGKDGDQWQEVLNRLNFGDMPPKEEPQIGNADRELITGWIVQEMRRDTLTKLPTTSAE